LPTTPSPKTKKQKRKQKKHTTESVATDTKVSVPAPGRLAQASLPFCDETICKTPVEWVDSALKHAFGNNHVMLKRCQHPDKMYSLEESHSDLDVVVMDCVLSRGRPVGMNKKARRKARTPTGMLLCRNVCSMMLTLSIWQMLFMTEMLLIASLL
jgi:hypothetical protein